jgi:hypothetical protein
MLDEAKISWDASGFRQALAVTSTARRTAADHFFWDRVRRQEIRLLAAGEGGEAGVVS